MKAPSLDDDMMDARQLGAVLKLDRRTIYKMVRDDGLPVIRVSTKCLRFEKAAVYDWLKRRVA